MRRTILILAALSLLQATLTLPGIAGEGCVLRVLDRSAVQLDLSVLGLSRAEEEELRELTHLPHGIVLITGPTGSGKSTTLAAMVDHINRTRAEHVITIEETGMFAAAADRRTIVGSAAGA